MLRGIIKIKSFKREHPVLSGIIVSAAIPVGIVACGFFLSLFVLLTSTCRPRPTETCDGVGLIAVSIWTLSISLASVLLVVVLIVAFVVLLAALLAYVFANLNMKKS